MDRALSGRVEQSFGADAFGLVGRGAGEQRFCLLEESVGPAPRFVVGAAQDGTGRETECQLSAFVRSRGVTDPLHELGYNRQRLSPEHEDVNHRGQRFDRRRRPAAAKDGIRGCCKHRIVE